MVKIQAYLRLFRVHHWVKNLFVFAPAFFAQRLLEIPTLLMLGIAFLTFSLVASVVYILNDYMDIEADRLHPRKKLRPLAAGEISPREALISGTILLTASLITAFLLSKGLFFILVGYFVMNVVYTLSLKHIAILDITIIAIGFLLRIYAGGMAADVEISRWIILLTFLLAMLLALAKRRDEFILHQKGNTTRKSIVEYNLTFINTSMTIMAAVTVVSYIMYTVSPEVVARLGTEDVFLTTIFVILGIMRYLQITMVFEESGSPTRILLKDRFIQLVLLAWMMSFFLILYVKYQTDLVNNLGT